jgi:polyisoprenoid-binding protein YceI
MTSSEKPIIALVLSIACALGSSIAVAQGGMGGGAPRGPQVIVPLTHKLSEVKSGEYELEHDHGRIIWTASHHGFSMFSGVLPLVYGKLIFDADDPTRSQLSATVHMTEVSTQIPIFDERANSDTWLNTSEFPLSTFESTKIEMISESELRVTGDLTFLGVTKPATMDVNFVQAGNVQPPGGGYRIGFNGTMLIKRSDFGMPLSTVSDEVTLRLEAEWLEPGMGHEWPNHG